MQMEKENFACAMLIHMLSGYTGKKENLKERENSSSVQKKDSCSKQKPQSLQTRK